MNDIQLAAFELDNNDLRHLYQVVTVYNDVRSVDVCSYLCIQGDDIEDLLNSWLYDFFERTCSCTQITDLFCADNVGTVIDHHSMLSKPETLGINRSMLFIDQTRVNY